MKLDSHRHCATVRLAGKVLCVLLPLLRDAKRQKRS